MTVNTEIGHHVSPFCPRAHCWRTSADNLAARRTSECGSCQGLSTKGKFLKRETCVRDISETLDLAFLFVTYIHIYYIHIYIHIRTRASKTAGRGGGAHFGKNRSRFTVSSALPTPVGIRNGEARMCTYVPGVTSSRRHHRRDGRPPSRRERPVSPLWSASRESFRDLRVIGTVRSRCSSGKQVSPPFLRFFFSFSSIGFLLLCRSPFPPPGGNSHVWGTWAK